MQTTLPHALGLDKLASVSRSCHLVPWVYPFLFALECCSSVSEIIRYVRPEAEVSKHSIFLGVVTLEP